LECSPVPKPILATVAEEEQHLHPGKSFEA
jgi:hypothetical protein